MRSLFVHVETDGSHRVFETMCDRVVVALVLIMVDSFADAGDATVVEEETTVVDAMKPNSRRLRRVLSS